MTSVQTISAPAALTATTNGAATDITDFHGVCKFVLSTSETDADEKTSTVKIQESDNGSTGWVDTDIAFATTDHTAAATLEIVTNIDKFKKFVRAVTTLVGATPKVTNCVMLVGSKQYED